MANVADRIIDALVQSGNPRIWVMPGSSLNTALEALGKRDDITTIFPSSEGAAGHAAVAVGMQHGLGVVAASQGAGSSELARTAWVAAQNNAPVLIFVGQSPEARVGADGAFQSFKAKELFGAAKKILRLERGGNTAQTISNAIALASKGAPGPVVIEMPSDVLGAQDTSNSFVVTARSAVLPSRATEKAIFETAGRIDKENAKPMFILGDVYRAEAKRDPEIQKSLDNVSQKIGAAVGTTHGAADQWPTNDERSIGNFGYNLLASQGDVFKQFNLPILLGAKPDDNLTRQIGEGWTKEPYFMVYPDKKY
jgi:acetolactate synthase-1/2/3 large subunit